jgi:hypothetical protein
MSTTDRSWFKRKVRALGDVLRGLLRRRRQTFERESAPARYPAAHGRDLYEPTRLPTSGEGTYTPSAPYGEVPDAARRTRVRQQR